ncbi:MAG: adenylosuccinate synthetase, partial [Candidatus Paceibacterota bacterium]
MAERAPQHLQGTNVVLDAGWGDNGKGKLVDIGSQYADLVVRWAGGPNAGHTVKNELGEFKFHLMPSGIFNSLCVLGDTVVIDPDILLHEIDELDSRGFPVDESNLLISADASLILDWHKGRDALSETARGGRKIGTTGRGIGPTYADRTDRTGLQFHHLYEPDFEKRLMREFVWQTRLTRLMEGDTRIGNLSREDFEGSSPRAFSQMVMESIGSGPYDFEEMYNRLITARERLKQMVTNVFPVIQEVHRGDGNLLGEGAQGALLDLDLGTTPFVTSSHPTIEGFGIATGIHANEVSNVFAATRAYGARVGEGP